MRNVRALFGVAMLVAAASAHAAVGNCPTIDVAPTSIAGATQYQSYSSPLTASGGAGGPSFSLSAGALPNGVTLNATGVLIGTPTVTGNFLFTATGTDSNGCSGGRVYVLSVVYVNHAPSFTKGADQSVAEDAGAQTVNAWASAIQDNDGNSQTVDFIVSNNNNALFSVQPSVAANGTLTYTPAPSANGSASVSVQIHDNGGTANGGVDTSAAQTFTITVNAVNQAPSFTKGADQTVLEDAAAQSVAGWATGMSAGPANESGQVLNFIVSNDNNGLFAVQPAVAANGTLSYTLAANANGSATVSVALHDDGGTANGGADTSATQTFAINVTAVNDVPSFSKGADQNVLEDAGAQSVAGWATALSAGPANESGQTLNFIVSNNNNALFSAQPAIAANGTLTYTPAANANGSATVTVQIHDNGGTTNGGVDTSAAQTFAINVTAVNDAPSFTKGANQTVNDNAGAQSVANWATAISAGPANEAGQTVSFAIASNDHPELFSAGPAVASNGTLTYTPTTAPTGTTTATITLHAVDNGGTANGGVDTSANQSFTIAVTHVIPPPSVTNDTYVATGNISIAANAANGVLANDSPNGATLKFGPNSGSENNAGATGASAQGGILVVQNDGSFSYNPPRGFNGSDSFKYRLTNASGNSTATVTITVSDRVWFINSAAGACSATCDGRLSNPYTSITAFNSANNNTAPNPRANDVVFVHTGAGNYVGPLVLLSGQKLTGQGVALSTALTAYGITLAPLSVATPAAGAKPTLAFSLAMPASSRVEGLNITVTGATQGLTGTGVSGLTVGGIANSDVVVSAGAATAVSMSNVDSSNFTFRSISASGGVNGILLSNLNATAGTFAVVGDGSTNKNNTGGSISATTGNGIQLSNVRSASFAHMSLTNAIYNNVSIETTSNAIYFTTTAANTAPAAMSVSYSTFTGNQGHGVYAHIFGSTRTDVTVQNNTLDDTGNVGGLPTTTLWYDGGGGTAFPNTSNRYIVSNNTGTVTGTTFFAVNINSVTTPAKQTVSGKSDNNVMAGVPTTGFASGMNFSIGDSQNSHLVMQANGNSMSNLGGNFISLNRGTGLANIDTTLLNNTASSGTPNASATIALIFCPSSAPACTGGDMRVHVAGNNIHGFDAGTRSFRLRQLSPAMPGVHAFEGFTGVNDVDLTNYLKATNTNVDVVQYSNAVPSPFYTGAPTVALVPP